MKEIQLTQGQVALVDDEDYEWLNQYKWKAQWNTDTHSFYAVRSGDGSQMMHREIIKTQKGMICDHKNHDTLCNLKTNLRNITPSQSNMNRRVQKNNLLGEKGICRHGSGYRVQISINRKYVFRKFYKTLQDAKNAYKEASEKFHGEYSYSKNEE